MEKCILFDNSKSYVAKTTDETILNASSSGGIFYHLAKNFIEKGGYVCGCVYDEDFMPKHIVSKKICEIEKMMGSKYVTSDLSEVLKEIRDLLNEGNSVLFSGVPCQAAALKKYLENNTQISDEIIDDKMFVVCMVCHGSIDRKIWKAYLEKESERGKITNVTMRDKSKGWLNYGLKFDFKDGSHHTTYRNESGYFLSCFTSGVFERKTCLNCEHKGNNILADVLLGDAWQMEKYYPELADEKGLSDVICITEKGVEQFKQIKDGLKCIEVDTGLILETNPRILTPEKAIARTKKFMKEFDDNPSGILELCEKYSKITFIERLKNKLGL